MKVVRMRSVLYVLVSMFALLVVLLTFFLVNASSSVTYPVGAHQVKEISLGTQSSTPTDLIDVNGTLYFQAINGEYGHELWKSDGTGLGTVSIGHLEPHTYFYGTPEPGRNPRPPSYYPNFDSLVEVDGLLYFAYNDELWRSDGTEVGTYGINNSPNPEKLTKGQDLLFFTAENSLWHSNGTEVGTVLLKSFGREANNLMWVNDTLYFTVDDTSSAVGDELWISDGTGIGTVLLKDINSGAGSSQPNYFVEMNGLTYFAATDNLGRELWQSDGTEVGTSRVTDIFTGTGSSEPAYLTVMNDAIYFSADDGSHGAELWLSDGTEAGTQQVKEINLTGDANPAQFTVVGNLLYFSANDGVHGTELWVSDGTEAGTMMVADISLGANNSTPEQLTAVNGTLFFSADDGVHGVELWQSDGTEAGTLLVKDLQAGAESSELDELTAVNNTLYFRATDDLLGSELWRSDGTEDGTIMVKDVNHVPETNYPKDFHDAGETFYFRAHDIVHGYELWQSDGSEAGTTLVKDIFPGYSPAYPYDFTNFGDDLLFKADDGSHGYELWRTDGTEAGTVMVKDIAPGDTFPASYSSIFDTPMLVKDNIAYLAVDDDTHGLKPWRTDGTETGTYLIKNIRTGSSSSNPSNFTDVNDSVVFSANDGIHGLELWRTDGTEAGTFMVKDINLSGDGLGGSKIEVLDDIGYFVGDNGVDQRELWRTDGTTSGTYMVKEINPTGHGIPSYGNFRMEFIDGVGYFLANDGVHGTELWRTDGTAEGTYMVIDLTESIFGFLQFKDGLFFKTVIDTGSGNEYALWYSDGTEEGTEKVVDQLERSPDYFVQANTILYFTHSYYSNQSYTSTVWQSNGTVTGTMPIQLFNSYIYPLEAINDRLYFTVVNENYQNELWQTDGTEESTRKAEGIPEKAFLPPGEKFFSFIDTLFFALEVAPGQSEFWSMGNMLPVAQPDAATIPFGSGSVLIEVLANDTDMNNPDVLYVSNVSGAEHGTAVIEGSSIRYTPNNNFIGTEELVYTVADTYGGTDETTITIIVEGHHLYLPTINN